jgi:hypothetical protein
MVSYRPEEMSIRHSLFGYTFDKPVSDVVMHDLHHFVY